MVCELGNPISLMHGRIGPDAGTSGLAEDFGEPKRGVSK